MRVFRAEGVPSRNFIIPLTNDSAQQAVVILDATDEFVRPNNENRPDAVTLYLVDGALLAPDEEVYWSHIASFDGRELGTVYAGSPEMIRTAVLSFDPEPGEVLVARLSSGFGDERSYWKLRVLLDGLGTIPLIIEPANTGELIEGEAEDGSFISPIALDIHHIDAELEPKTRGVQTVGVTVQFDAETGYMIIGSGQLLDKNITTGETHLLARITSYVEFPVAVNYFPDANIEADFRRDIAGLALDITDMMLTKDGAFFGFEGYMPAELGGFQLTRGAFNAPDGEMLITRTGIAGAAEFSVADQPNSRMFGRFNADLSEVRLAYGEAANTLRLTPVVTLPDFIAPGVNLALNFSAGGGFVVENGAGRLEGGLSALGSYRLAVTEGADPLRVTLEALALDLSNPNVINLRTGVALDIGFGWDIRLPAIEARVGVTEDFTLDELVLELPELFDLPLAPPVFFLTAAKLGLYGLAPGGTAARANFEADISILPDMPLPRALEEVVDLGQITINGEIGTNGFEGGGHLTLGTLLGGSLIDVQTTVKVDAARQTLTATAITGFGLPLAGTAFVNNLKLTAGLDGIVRTEASITLGLASNIAWVLALAGLENVASATFSMIGHFSRLGDYADQYLEGGVELGIAGFHGKLSARLGMDGSLGFSAYDFTDAPEFMEPLANGAASRSAEGPNALDAGGTRRQGMEAREGQDLAMRSTGDTTNLRLIGPEGAARTLDELEADATDGITILRDGHGASIFISDAAAGRWAIEAPTANGFLAMEEQERLQLSAQFIEQDGERLLDLAARTADGSDAGNIRLEVYRDSDDSGFDGTLAAVTISQDGRAQFSMRELGLPEGQWNLHVRAMASAYQEARIYVPEALAIAAADLPDRAGGCAGWRLPAWAKTRPGATAWRSPCASSAP